MIISKEVLAYYKKNLKSVVKVQSVW